MRVATKTAVSVIYFNSKMSIKASKDDVVTIVNSHRLNCMNFSGICEERVASLSNTRVIQMC